MNWSMFAVPAVIVFLLAVARVGWVIFRKR